MLIERVELTLSHVDLGVLTEAAAMTLFGITHAHRITAGTGHSIRAITDHGGAPLYPGYYWTLLRVPPARLLREHQVWDTVEVGVDVSSFGGALLASSYVLGRPDELREHEAPGAHEHLPSLQAGSMFYVDGEGGDPKPATPKRGTIAALPALTSAPAALQRFRELRDLPSIDPGFAGTLGRGVAITYPLRAGHVIRGDHGVMFARYIEIADAVERELLCRHAWPPVPGAVADCLAVLERETCYYANVRGEQIVRAHVRASFEPCPPDLHGDNRELVSAGVFRSVIELYDDSNVLLVSTKARKLVATPTAQPRLVTLAARVLADHGPKEIV